MQKYRLLKFLGWVWLFGGGLMVVFGVAGTAVALLNALGPYSTAYGDPGIWRATKWLNVFYGALVILSGVMTMGLSQLIDLLFEIRAKLTGNAVNASQ